MHKIDLKEHVKELIKDEIEQDLKDEIAGKIKEELQIEMKENMRYEIMQELGRTKPKSSGSMLKWVAIFGILFIVGYFVGVFLESHV
jgi:hypothetical protein